MVLDSLVYNPGASDNSLLVNLVHGPFVFVSGEIAPMGGMTVETPVASIGIRGTMVSLSIKAINGETEGSLLRSEEHTSELQSLMRISYAVFCLKKKKRMNKDYSLEKTTE